MSTKIVIKSSLLVTNLEKKDQGNKELRFFRMLILIGLRGNLETEDGFQEDSYFSIIEADVVVADSSSKFFSSEVLRTADFQWDLNSLMIEAGVVVVDSSFEGS